MQAKRNKRHPCLLAFEYMSSSMGCWLRRAAFDRPATMCSWQTVKRQAGLQRVYMSMFVLCRNPDLTVCPGVRVEDMGHKMGCNGVDNVRGRAVVSSLRHLLCDAGGDRHHTLHC